MGIFSAIGSLFGGPGQVIGTVADGILGRKDAEDTNEQNVTNARMMRQTAYQDTVQDMQAAGLNPMLAYSNGATSGTMPPMQNKGLSSAQQSSANSAAELSQAAARKTNAETTNAEAQTDLIKAQILKTLAEVPNINASTTNVTAQTDQIRTNITNLQAELHRITMDTDLKYQQGLTEVDRRNLMDAQRRLADIQRNLAGSNISNVEAQTETQKVLTELRKYEIPGAKNLADFEKTMDSGSGNIPKALGGMAGSATQIIQLLRSLQSK